jgi:hypothetical protein
MVDFNNILASAPGSLITLITLSEGASLGSIGNNINFTSVPMLTFIFNGGNTVNGDLGDADSPLG